MMEENKTDHINSNPSPWKRRRIRKRDNTIKSIGCGLLILVGIIGLFILVDQLIGPSPFLSVIIFIGALLTFFKYFFKIGR